MKVLQMGVVIRRWMHVEAVGRRISTKQSDSLATIKESLVLICIDNIGSCHCHLKEAAGARDYATMFALGLCHTCFEPVMM